jgi:hypothetical protein
MRQEVAKLVEAIREVKRGNRSQDMPHIIETARKEREADATPEPRRRSNEDR